MSHSTPTQGNINHSMRTNYSEFGVDEYYRKVNASYRNPFFPGIRKVVFALLDRWWKEEGRAGIRGNGLGVHEDRDEDEGEDEVELRILDMAAGSGEASLVVEEWYHSRFPPLPGPSTSTTSSITKLVSTSTTPSTVSTPPPSTSSPSTSIPPSQHPLASLRSGPSRFPLVNRPVFIPPGRKDQRATTTTTPKLVPDKEEVVSSRVVMPRGTGQERGLGMNTGMRGNEGRRPKLVLMATDPYTVPAYETRTGKKCLPLSFSDIAQGKLGDLSTDLDETDSSSTTPTSRRRPGRRSSGSYDLVICSFALHLVGSASEMFALLYELSTRSRWLAVIAPHKKPEIKEGWGYTRWNFESWTSTLEGEVSVDGDEDEDEDEEEGDRTGRSRSTATTTTATLSVSGAKDGGLVNHGQEIVLDRVRCRLYRSVEG